MHCQKKASKEATIYFTPGILYFADIVHTVQRLFNKHFISTARLCLLLSTAGQAMRYVAAYLLASMGGNKDPSAADIEKILGSVGIESDSERLKKVISELKGKSVDEVIAKGF
ncbi:hypothetical protein V5799_015920 [Amblyomma americanum]|uniref:Large ribosomal subunit protein P2 n=1 Tax=Amblyomma americanum TaxID=6943 RepID=A0AAQ4F6I4_AMBAM